MTTGPVAAPGDVEARLAEHAEMIWEALDQKHDGAYHVHAAECCWAFEGSMAAIQAVLAPVVADEVARAVEPFKALADELDTEIAAADRVGRACPDGGCGTCVRHGAAARLRALLGAGQ